MNKKIIGVSLAMLFAATGALAQTSVTMYGTVDAGVAYQHGAYSDGKVFSLESGQQSYSRIGFKGTEDLGGGMKAIFLLEQGIQIDTGNSGYNTLGSNNLLSSGGTFSSQAYVGLSSNFGTVKLGRQFSPLYDAYMAIDPFKNGFAANMNNFFGAVPVGITVGDVTVEFTASPLQRMSNAIVYNTPDNLYGFKGALAYGFGEQAGSAKANSQIGASLGYENGPLTIAYAYHQANDFLGLAEDTFKTHFIGASYDFGVAKVHAAFDQNKIADGFKTQDYMVGVTVPVGMHSVFADYTRKQDKIYDHADAQQYAIGYKYNLSKRTNFYTAYTHVKNDEESVINTYEPGNNTNTFQIGVNHTF